MSTSRQEVAGGLAGGAAGVDPEASGSGEAAAAGWPCASFQQISEHL